MVNLKTHVWSYHFITGVSVKYIKAVKTLVFMYRAANDHKRDMEFDTKYMYLPSEQKSS